ncbi:hypothetical protein AXF24_12530 [Streptococcus pneumoniae]|nr:hypothetical protein AXF24_12530 [Streptococcus pneumoniae]
MDIYGAWHNDKEGIFLDARIKDGTNAQTRVNGYIYPLKPASGLDLYIDADSLNIKFLEFYMKDIVQNIQGPIVFSFQTLQLQ